MAKIVIVNLYNRALPVLDAKRTILQHFQDSRIDWMHACGGKGRCTTCKVVVLSGIDNISPLTTVEIRYRSLHALGDNERLSCQAQVSGEIEIAAPEEYKLPHVSYSD